MMRTLRTSLLALALPLAACADADPAELTAAPDTPPLHSTASPACVTFGPPPPLLTVWGTPVGHVPGQAVHAENNVVVHVQNFTIGASTVFNWARLEMPPSPFGTGQTARTNYINLGFTYPNLGWVPKKARFQFLDPSTASVENIRVNGALKQGQLSTLGGPLGGTTVTVGPGIVDISGPAINSFEVGGQQLWIDNVCVYM
jgi:hypothetical protein